MISILLVVLAAGPEPITFEAAVERALAHHPAMRVAEQDAARAMAQLEQARAPSLPTLVGNSNFSVLDADRRLPDTPEGPGRLVQGRQQFSANLQLAAPLVSTPRWAQWYRASQAVDAVRATANDVKRQVAVNAARGWLSVLALKRAVAAATLARDSARAHLDYAHERFSGGVGNKLDELRAAQELSVSTTQLETALSALIRSQEALGVLTGADVPLDIVAEEPDFTPPGGVEQALEAAGSVRLDVKAAEVRKDSALASTKVDWMDYLPLLNAVFQPFYQNPATITQPVTGWQLSLVLQLPLYDGGLRYGQSKERRANAKSAEAQFEGALRQAKSEVRSAFKQVTHADAALESAKESAKQAGEALELATLAYRAGATTNLEVIDAERRARDAELVAVLAEDNARQARLDFLVASGAFPR
jgi:outer membrane protein TolC